MTLNAPATERVLNFFVWIMRIFGVLLLISGPVLYFKNGDAVWITRSGLGVDLFGAIIVIAGGVVGPFRRDRIATGLGAIRAGALLGLPTGTPEPLIDELRKQSASGWEGMIWLATGFGLQIIATFL